MTKYRSTFALVSAALALTLCSATLAAQDEQPQQAQEPQPAQTQQPAAQPAAAAKPDLWIAKYEVAETKAAAAVASVQSATSNALKYSYLFNSIKTFESHTTQPEGTWTLTAKEIEFSGGSTAKRALWGFGSGRAKITMEYTLYDASKKVVWTKKITTKPSFWGSAGVMGAVQNQDKAMDEQGQKLTDGLAKFFGETESKGGH